jgi:hypothetical protein
LLLEAILIRRLWSTKEGVGETSGQTVGSPLREFALSEIDPAEETGFLRSVRVLRSAIPPAVFARVKSGPDVFADALVPSRTISFLSGIAKRPARPPIDHDWTCVLTSLKRSGAGLSPWQLDHRIDPGDTIQLIGFRQRCSLVRTGFDLSSTRHPLR